MKKNMNIDAINVDNYETVLKDKIGMLWEFLGFELEDDL